MLRLPPDTQPSDTQPPDAQPWPHEDPEPAVPAAEVHAAPVPPAAPLVSVVIANHDNARFIESALRSVLSQTLRELEVLVADDASTDDGPERVAAIAATDGRVRLLRAERNGGPGAARNRALDVARGRWIAVVDGDDLLHPDRLRRLIEAAEADGADIATDNLMVFDDAGRLPPHAALRGAMGREPRWVDAAEYVRANALDGPGPALGVLKPVLRADRLRGLRYDPTLRIAEDYDLVARLLADGARLRCYPFLTYFYRKHGASISHRLSRATLLPMLAADDGFRARLPVPPPPALLAALDRRRRSLEDALGFETLVAALKARRPAEAVRAALHRPRAAALLRVPLRDRLRRLRHRAAAPAAPPATPPGAARAPRVCVLSRQRVVGAVNGSSAYLLGLCEALRGAGWELDLVSPSPAVFGRWPALPLRPEMSLFRAMHVRGAWRVGRCFVARDPAVAMQAVVAAADRLRGRLGLRPRGARAPLSIAVPWTEADQLFVARHARGADLLLADYAFLAEGAAFALNPETPLVVVMHDLFSSQTPPIIGLDAEMRLLSQADAIVAIQEEEAAVVRRLLPDARLLLAPMAAPTVPAPQPGTDERTAAVRRQRHRAQPRGARLAAARVLARPARRDA